MVSRRCKDTSMFSAREIAKLMLGLQAEVYGQEECCLTEELLNNYLEQAIKDVHRKKILRADKKNNFA